MVIVVHLVNPWTDFHRRPMLEALARQTLGQATIICINPTISLRKVVSLSLKKQNIEGLLTFGGLKRFADNLYVGTPAIFLPGSGRLFQEVGSIAWRKISQQIRQAVGKIALANEKIVAWVYRPEQLYCLGLAGEDFVAYECYDEYRLSFYDGSELTGVKDAENRLLQEADIVFATAQALFESRKKRHSNVHYAPNGVDFDLFNQAAHIELPAPKDLKGIPSPRIGYVGNLSGRVDFVLLADIADKRKHWSLVLIGPVAPEAKDEVVSLARRPNVYFLGQKPRPRLPNYLKGFDACVVPFKDHGWNLRSNPLKLWEYLAAGRPVVSTMTDASKDLEDVISLANNREEFLGQLDSLFSQADSSKVERGIELARSRSWDLLTSTMFSVVKASAAKISDPVERMGSAYVHVRCNLCGADNAELYAVAASESCEVLHKTRVRCRKCGLVYSDPQATDSAMAEYYSKKYPLILEELKGEVKTFYDETFFLDPYDEKRQMQPGRFLDVGCAHGFKVKTAENLGWEAHGVELSEAFCAYARHALKLHNIIHGTLFDAGYTDDYFDYVVVWHVLEHVRDAKKLLQEIERILKPGSHLFIGVPNISEPIYQTIRLTHWLKRRNTPMATSDHHTYEFTHRTLTRMVQRASPDISVTRVTVYYDKAQMDHMAHMAMNWKGKLQMALARCLATLRKDRVGNLIMLRGVKR